eukprot:CAMPEP_0119155152 /NCGR_PEP_ID=MMETSP1310-20130426/51601_1 /TAXON_ID=464262 /ORGANISM="Genus nov. species nov., Strain RCC2339" /LENGTH=438 /DNA_ID=CAMNT_0007147739 /DNA_START=150 /DNA_END=1466 /DNA_ORIENTATION=+
MAAIMDTTSGEKVELLWQAAHHLPDFRLPELEALACMFGADIEVREQISNSPFLIVAFPSEEIATRMAQRSVLCKRLVALTGRTKQGGSLEELVINAEVETKRRLGMSSRKGYRTFKIKCDSFGRDKSSKAQQLEMISTIGVHFDVNWKVKLKQPDIYYSFIEDYGLDRATNRHIHETPRYFFGERLSKGARRNGEHLPWAFQLSKRPYIGTTSMDPIVSFLMANLACVSNISYVWDPFIGTGSIAVSCAYFGGRVVGTDIDPRVIRGKKGKSVITNFQYYGLTGQLDCLLAHDVAQPIFTRQEGIFDAIVCDPPYGIRAGAKKIGRKRKLRGDPENFSGSYYSAKEQYPVATLLADLMTTAARLLRLGGRLVFFVPANDCFENDHIVMHPCLKLLSTCHQRYRENFRRVLFTCEKVCQFNPSIHANFQPNMKYSYDE